MIRAIQTACKAANRPLTPVSAPRAPESATLWAVVLPRFPLRVRRNLLRFRPVVLRLNTLEAVRGSLARVTRETAKGTLALDAARVLTRQLAALLLHDRTVAALELAERLDAIEARLDEADKAAR